MPPSLLQLPDLTTKYFVAVFYLRFVKVNIVQDVTSFNFCNLF